MLITSLLLVACSSWRVSRGLLRLISYTIQDHVPRDGTSHRRPGPSILTINQEKAPTDLLTGQIWAFSQLNLRLLR